VRGLGTSSVVAVVVVAAAADAVVAVVEESMVLGAEAVAASLESLAVEETDVRAFVVVVAMIDGCYHEESHDEAAASRAMLPAEAVVWARSSVLTAEDRAVHSVGAVVDLPD